MSTTVTEAFVKQFTQGIRLLQQQMGSNLREGVLMDTVKGDRAFYDQVGATSMTDITSRHGDTEYTDTPHSRRMVVLTPSDVADLVDRQDKVRTLNDPTNSYVRAFAAAANRKIDDRIIAAFDATASTGVDGTGTAPFDTAYDIAVGAAGMTLAKLREARELLEAAENMEDDGEYKWFIAMDAKGRADLLGDTTLTSSDYNTVKALVDGQINTFMGFTFLKSERIPQNATPDAQAFAWCKSSMQLAIGQEPKGFIDILPGKKHSTQVRYELDSGATRMDEKGVVRIAYQE